VEVEAVLRHVHGYREILKIPVVGIRRADAKLSRDFCPSVPAIFGPFANHGESLSRNGGDKQRRHRNIPLVFFARVNLRPTGKARPVVPFSDHETERGPEIFVGDRERAPTTLIVNM